MGRLSNFLIGGWLLQSGRFYHRGESITRRERSFFIAGKSLFPFLFDWNNGVSLIGIAVDWFCNSDVARYLVEATAAVGQPIERHVNQHAQQQSDHDKAYLCFTHQLGVRIGAKWILHGDHENGL